MVLVKYNLDLHSVGLLGPFTGQVNPTVSLLELSMLEMMKEIC